MLVLFSLSLVSILAIITISLSNSLYPQENQTETTQLPETTKGPVIPSKGYLVEEIRDGLFWVTDDAYNTLFLVTDEGVVAVDALSVSFV